MKHTVLGFVCIFYLFVWFISKEDFTESKMEFSIIHCLGLIQTFNRAAVLNMDARNFM